MTATLTPPAAPTLPRPVPNPPRRPVRAGGPGNLVLPVLTLASVVGLARLFGNPSPFLWPVVLTTVVVHAVAWQCRRANLALGPSAVLVAVSAVLCVSWTVFRGSTAYGIPWLGTWHAARGALSAASEVYRTTAPPAPALPGFTLAGAFGAASASFLADWAAFRMRATTEACLPSFSLFVLSCALAQGHHIVLAAAVWLGALLAFLLVRQPALDGPATAWFASRNTRGVGTIAASGAVIAAVGVAAAALLGPSLPGATKNPVIDWRHQAQNSGGRNTGSPLVDIKARLHDESQQEVFTVSTPRPVYWRLTSLNNFDGSGWSLKDTYQRAGGSLPTSLPPGAAEQPLHTDFQLGTLSSIWLPAPYRAVHLSGIRRINYSPDASSFITSQSTSDGLAYNVDSEIPSPSVDALRAAARANPADPAIAPYLQLPRTVPASVLNLAVRETRGAQTPYDEAVMLQDWLRGPTFRYSLNVPPDDSQDALINFLTRSRAGFCQQFAGAYAVLARALGLPARVAVGFTEGQFGADGVWHVRDADAHAWPEIYFPGAGWVAFEPTPGRGSPDPNAEAVTGVTPPPSGPSPAQAPTTTAGPTAGGPATTAGPATPKDRSLDQSPPTSARHRGLSAAAIVGLVVVGAPLAWALLLAAAGFAVGRRRRARAVDGRAVVDLAWDDAKEALTRQRTPPRSWETPAEYARRASRSAGLPGEPAAALSRLATLVEVSDYSAAGPDADQAGEARDAAAAVAAAAGADERWWARALRLLDPRPLLRAMGVSPRA